MKLKLSDLSYKTYVYLFDIKYFAKTIKDGGYEEDDIDTIIKDAEVLYKLFLNAIESKSNIDKYNILIEAVKLAGQLLNDLKTVCCMNKNINEKTDLIVETFAIKEKTEAFINFILKEKDN